MKNNLAKAGLAALHIYLQVFADRAFLRLVPTVLHRCRSADSSSILPGYQHMAYLLCLSWHELLAFSPLVLQEALFNPSIGQGIERGTCVHSVLFDMSNYSFSDIYLKQFLVTERPLMIITK